MERAFDSGGPYILQNKFSLGLLENKYFKLEIPAKYKYGKNDVPPKALPNALDELVDK